MILTHLPKQTVYATLTLTILSLILYLIRVVDTGKLTFFYMVWNLVLAFIPLILSQLLIVLSFHKKTNTKRGIIAVVFLNWILFIPNAPYLLTDLIHLKLRDSTPLWFDLLFLQSMALAGILLWISSVYQVEQIFYKKYSRRYSTAFALIIIFLTSAGVSLGRFFRFNSWDAFVAPQKILYQLFLSGQSTTKIFESITFAILLFFILCCLYFFFTGLVDRAKPTKYN